jgi:hypothetical protein
VPAAQRHKTVPEKGSARAGTCPCASVFRSAHACAAPGTRAALPAQAAPVPHAREYEIQIRVAARTLGIRQRRTVFVCAAAVALSCRAAPVNKHARGTFA